ncbi:HAD family hydrolase [Novosphingobium bradum]|uniref:HAD family hydrolase n=1 Tax=Novosphingobium bradum TaxID=1737444 RepID=A0ABV7IPS9_9SPHN
MAGRIEAVVFDVGRVLVEWDLGALYRPLIPDPAECAWFLENVVSEAWHFQHDAGRSPTEMVAERSAEFPDHAELIAAWATRFNETIPGPVPGTADLVEALHARGVPLYAITNFGAEFWAGFRPHWPVIGRFRDVVVSGVEKVTKPDQRIYEIARARFGHAAEAMLFIDDNAANIEAARACGWQGHHFTDAAGLEADLRARGLIG